MIKKWLLKVNCRNLLLLVYLTKRMSNFDTHIFIINIIDACSVEWKRVKIILHLYLLLFYSHFSNLCPFLRYRQSTLDLVLILFWLLKTFLKKLNNHFQINCFFPLNVFFQSFFLVQVWIAEFILSINYFFEDKN